MPTTNEKRFKVFYSWQSDLPEPVNLKLIRNSLNQAAAALNVDHDLNLHVVIDEATREVPGSPHIPGSIFSKIQEDDVFVCDLTKVAEVPNDTGELRKYHNPNVAIELGYAIRVLGWSRIIIVFNTGYGVVPDDLPFDTRTHRATDYCCKAELDQRGRPTAACQSLISNSTGNLRTTFVDALKLIYSENPQRPQDLEDKSVEVIRRERDVRQLKEVFSYINVKMLDRFIERVLNSRLQFLGMELCDALGGIVTAARFHLHDTTLCQLICDFHRAWKQCSKYQWSMENDSTWQELRFVLPGDRFVSVEQETQYNETAAFAMPLRRTLDALLDYVRTNYKEIDTYVSGEEAVRSYQS